MFNLLISQVSKHNRSNKKAKHVDRRAHIVQAGIITHQVPLGRKKGKMFGENS